MQEWIEAHSEKHFNPRNHEECDPDCSKRPASTGRFQSTHSRGVRRDGLQKGRSSAIISIHALTRSATEMTR